jgi:uncharacterized protein YjgD (DUF1641 family)
MKELKNMIWTDLMKGFSEIQFLFSAFQLHLENLNGKGNEEEIEEFLENQMTVLRTLSDSHLFRMQSNIIKGANDWKHKKEKDPTKIEEEIVNTKRR